MNNLALPRNILVAPILFRRAISMPLGKHTSNNVGPWVIKESVFISRVLKAETQGLEQKLENSKGDLDCVLKIPISFSSAECALEQDSAKQPTATVLNYFFPGLFLTLAIWRPAPQTWLEKKVTQNHSLIMCLRGRQRLDWVMRFP